MDGPAPTSRMLGATMTNEILIVDDDPGAIQLMGRILADLGSLRFATGGEQGLRLAHERLPDLILLDAEMPGMSGFHLCQAIKSDPVLADVPVIFVTSHREAAFEVTGFDLGAADFIGKPICAPLLLARVKTQLRVKRLSDELRRVASVDSLTGVANRRRLDDSLQREWHRARRNAEPLTLMLIDVDHFKLFNDHYGHPAGDVCLTAIAQALVASCLRPADLVARYGGEEFALLLPTTPRDGGERMARRMLAAVDALAIPHEASLTARRVSASIGVACYDEASACWRDAPAHLRFTKDSRSECSVEDLLLAADRALYAAKLGGRAQAALLDVSDVQRPQRARAIAPSPGPAPAPGETGPLR